MFVNGLWWMASLTGFFFFPGVVIFGVTWLLYVWLFELDPRDAGISVVALNLIMFVLNWIIIMLLITGAIGAGKKGGVPAGVPGAPGIYDEDDDEMPPAKTTPKGKGTPRQGK
jgi:hypothetical protein